MIEALSVSAMIAVVPACSPGSVAQDTALEPSPAAVAREQASAMPAPPHEQRAELSQSATKGAAALTRVEDPSSVCMVNNQYMGRPQIPVVVEGRTYFGCCEGCKGRLEKDQSVRMATDPVSHRPVDKATAIIGRDTSNRVLYFESTTTYGQYTGS